jgi:hypothetical protein
MLEPQSAPYNTFRADFKLLFAALVSLIISAFAYMYLTELRSLPVQLNNTTDFVNEIPERRNALVISTAILGSGLRLILESLSWDLMELWNWASDASS